MTMNQRKLPNSRHQAGMTLIEVLVAILIFSFGLVGLIGLQARSLQFSTSAEDTSRAALLANEMATIITTSNSLSPAASAVAAWQARVSDPAHGGLPNPTATVVAASGVATITIKWKAPSAASSAFNSENQYITQVVLP